MKNSRLLTIFTLFSFFFISVSCTTDDVVEGENPGPVLPDQVELHDDAFGEFLLFREVPGVTSELKDNKKHYFINPKKVAAVAELNLSKTKSNIETLENAGLETAESKIEDLSGLEYFIGLKKLVLTSNSIQEIDVTQLTELEALELNFNLIGSLDLSQNTKLTRLRYKGSASASDDQKLSSIDLKANVLLKHLYLPDHNLKEIDLSANKELDDLIDLTGNPGPDGDTKTGDIVIPQEIYDQLEAANRLGVIGGTPQENPENIEISDKAFGEYLIYKEIPGITAEGEGNGKRFYLDPDEVSGVEELNLSKTKASISELEEAGVETADSKIEDLSGLEYFIGLKKLILTSNSIQEIDLTQLTELEALELNFNLIGSLDLSQNTQLTRLRYKGSASASDDQKLSSIDLKANVHLKHLYLPDHNLVEVDLSANTELDDLIDLSGNPGPDGDTETEDIVIPQEIYDQLEAGSRLGVIGGTPQENPESIEISDKAFGEYLMHKKIPGITAEGEGNDKRFYLDPDEVSGVEELNLSKTKASISELEQAGVETAESKIEDLSGLEYFVGLKKLVLTSNSIQEIDLTQLTELETLELNFNLIGNLDLSQNTKLIRLRYKGSASASDDQKLSSIDLKANVHLKHLYLPDHNLVEIDLSANTELDDLIDLSGNPGPDGDTKTGDIVIPEKIYDQLDAGNRIGVISDN